MLKMVLIDTSVLLRDPDVIERVMARGGLPFITNTILSELDSNKRNSDLTPCANGKTVGNNARMILRTFADINAVDVAQMPDGNPLVGGDKLRKLSFNKSPIYVLARENPNSRSEHDNDFKIIETAKKYGMIVITRDKAFKVRAEVEGVEAYVHTRSDSRPSSVAAPKDTNKKMADTATPSMEQPFVAPTNPLREQDAPLLVSIVPRTGDLVNSRKSGQVKLRNVLSAGGEGTIYETDKPDLVCKVYHKDKLTILRKKKVELMLTRTISREGICWPTDILLNSNNEFIGYLMPRARGRPIQSTMFIKPVLKKTFPNWARIDLVNLCLAFLDQIAYLHKLNIIVGDINPLNLLVAADSTRLWIVDTDSFQIERFPCTVGTVNFTAPEIQGKNYADFLRTKDHELFAVATMLFMILHPGKPPYAQQGGGNPAENIRKMDFSYPYRSDFNGKAPKGPWQNIWGNLTAKLKGAFSRTFKGNERIAIGEWQELLKNYRWAIEKGHNSNELFPTTFKIFDPVEVICGDCGAKVTASKLRVAKLAIEGKTYYCGECVEKISLKILAKKASEASRHIYQGGRSDHGNTFNSSTKTKQTTNSIRSHYKTQRPTQAPRQVNPGSGFLGWLLGIFK